MILTPHTGEGLAKTSPIMKAVMCWRISRSQFNKERACLQCFLHRKLSGNKHNWKSFQYWAQPISTILYILTTMIEEKQQNKYHINFHEPQKLMGIFLTTVAYLAVYASHVRENSTRGEWCTSFSQHCHMSLKFTHKTPVLPTTWPKYKRQRWHS